MRGALFAASVGLMLVLGYFHYRSGLAYDFHAFFILPVLVATWFLGFRSGLALALLSAGTWLMVDWTLGDEQVGRISLVFNTAMRLAIFVGEAWILEQLRRVLDREFRLAREDVLTGLANRRELYEQGRRALALARRQGAPFTAAFIDLDKFKEVNDESGHAVGDALLIHVANELRAQIRASDIVGRLGGDEFALLLPGMDDAAAQAYGEQRRQRLLAVMRERNWAVTFSIGIASYSLAPDNIDTLLADADSLMYEAKEGGRDRIVHRTMHASSRASLADAEGPGLTTKKPGECGSVG